MPRVIENLADLRRYIHRAIIRPDPYGLPGWMINSDQLATRLYEDFGKQFKSYTQQAFDVGAENGCFICYDLQKDVLKLGPLVWGMENLVLIHDCIGYRSLGSFHTHVHVDIHKLAFSPPDILNGLNEFVIVVGGALSIGESFLKALESADYKEFEMGILSPYNYWKLERDEQDEVDGLLMNAMLLLHEASIVAHMKPEGYVRKVGELELQSKQNMNQVFKKLDMVYVSL